MCQACAPILGSDANVKNTDDIWLLESDEPNLTLVEFEITGEPSSENSLKNSWPCMCGVFKRHEGKHINLKVICIEAIEVIVTVKR